MVPALPIESSEKALHIQQALDYMGLNPGDKLEGLSIQWAFIGSCTNGRIEDLRIAANILKGHHIAKGVTMYVVPGSMAVYHQAQKEGLEDVFTAAGADFRMPGCSMCIGMNGDQVPPGERVVSSTNRNFVGRQGPGSRTHLASPATVAASALAGHLVSPKNYINNEVCNESI
jgi:3-isopropylmalate/(R)-2-methylmalate dehydratase large subunit